MMKKRRKSGIEEEKKSGINNPAEHKDNLEKFPL
jgi:hypothetical protein